MIGLLAYKVHKLYKYFYPFVVQSNKLNSHAGEDIGEYMGGDIGEDVGEYIGCT